MYLGRIVEQAPIRPLMKDPRHPYTRGLLESLPGRSARRGRLPSIPGSVPSPLEVPPGCPYHPRCPHARAGRCDVGAPPALRPVGRPPAGEGRGARTVACVRAEEI